MHLIYYPLFSVKDHYNDVVILHTAPVKTSHGGRGLKQALDTNRNGKPNNAIIPQKIHLGPEHTSER